MVRGAYPTWLDDFRAKDGVSSEWHLLKSMRHKISQLVLAQDAVR